MFYCFQKVNMAGILEYNYDRMKVDKLSQRILPKFYTMLIAFMSVHKTLSPEIFSMEDDYFSNVSVMLGLL